MAEPVVPGAPGLPRVPGLVEVDLGTGSCAAFTTVATGNVSTVHGDRVRSAAARDALATWAGAPVVWVRQVHGADVLVVREGDEVAAPGTDAAQRVSGLPAADAVVTRRTDLTLAVVVADCVPVLLAEPRAGVVAAVHAGRRGLLDGVVEAALEAMVGLGADLRAATAAVGPAACGRCYEVPAPMREEAEARRPGVASTTSWGTPALDLPGSVARTLRRHGLRVQDSPGCTIEEDRWFSHRAATGSGRVGGRERPQGRTAAVVRRTG